MQSRGTGRTLLSPSEGRLSYATVVAEATNLQLQSGTHTSVAKDSVSSEAAPRRMSLVDVSGPLCGMPDGTTSYAQVGPNTDAPHSLIKEELHWIVPSSGTD